MNNIRSRTIFEKDELKSKSTSEAGYFQSLLHQHNEYMPMSPNEKEEMIRDNEMQFIEGYQSPVGPLKYMSDAAKEKVHQEID